MVYQADTYWGIARRLLVIILLCLGCGPEGRLQRPAEAGAPTPTMESPAGEIDQVASQVQQLRDAPARLEETAFGAIELSGVDSLITSLHSHGMEAVRALIECISDQTASRVRFRGADVPVGVLCGMALHRIAYPSARETDPRWPGVVTPLIAPAALKDAREAWERELAAGRIRIG